jgi:hypothetical protein
MSHSALLSKLWLLGFCDLVCLDSFISGGSPNECPSLEHYDFHEVLSGVPQGLVLGQILFLYVFLVYKFILLLTNICNVYLPCSSISKYLSCD